MKDLYIIAGLGNPGQRYGNTRHNVGFNAVDLIAGKYGISMTKLKFKALMGEGNIDGNQVLLVKPQTFMNLSGESIRDIVEWYKLPLERLIVIYDDIDLELGKIRVRQKGSAGTHNGMRSIIYQLGRDDFPRVRIGIGRPPEGWDLADYVLSRFSQDEGKIIGEAISQAAEQAVLILGKNNS